MYIDIYTKKASGHRSGFTLVEVLVSVAVFAYISVSIYQGYVKVMEVVRVSRVKVASAALANEQLEIIRNLPYADVGISGGLPAGKVIQNQTLTRDGVSFDVKATIRNIDDPFDGTIGGTPNDTSPADYKLIEVEISCPTCKNFQPVSFTSYVAPKGLETTSTNGALFVRVFNAVGQPVSGANVHIENNQASPPIVIDDTTNNDGVLQIVDAPPGVEAYEITVSKPGYSQEKTYLTGAPGNPNPVKPHATVGVQQVTQTSFSIDLTSTLNIASVSETCTPVGDIDFSLEGLKLIGTAPDVLKYNVNHITNGAGNKTIPALEWGTYNALLTDASYDLIGSTPLLPLTLNPSTNQDFKLIVASKDPRSLLVTVKDASTQLPLSGTSVTLEKTGYNNTLTTGRGFLRQTDWSGGAGQDNFMDPTRYYGSTVSLDVANPAGEIRLAKIFNDYLPTGNLISSTFDTGSASNFHQILWQPQNQPPDTGPDSVKFQVASNNDQATWNFLGPDGTSNTFYTLADMNINSVHNGDRYMRYNAFLETANTAWTPNVSDVSFTFTSACVPPGQVTFTGLDAGDYTLTVSKTGYQLFSNTVSVASPWQQYEVVLSP